MNPLAIELENIVHFEETPDKGRSTIVTTVDLSTRSDRPDGSLSFSSINDWGISINVVIPPCRAKLFNEGAIAAWYADTPKDPEWELRIDGALSNDSSIMTAAVWTPMDDGIARSDASEGIALSRTA